MAKALKLRVGGLFCEPLPVSRSRLTAAFCSIVCLGRPGPRFTLGGATPFWLAFGGGDGLCLCMFTKYGSFPALGLDRMGPGSGRVWAAVVALSASSRTDSTSSLKNSPEADAVSKEDSNFAQSAVCFPKS